jgi:hypothetical protein
VVEGVLCDRAPDPLRRLECLGLLHLGHHEEELLAAIATDVLALS